MKDFFRTWIITGSMVSVLILLANLLLLSSITNEAVVKILFTAFLTTFASTFAQQYLYNKFIHHLFGHIATVFLIFLMIILSAYLLGWLENGIVFLSLNLLFALGIYILVFSFYYYLKLETPKPHVSPYLTNIQGE